MWSNAGLKGLLFMNALFASRFLIIFTPPYRHPKFFILPVSNRHLSSMRFVMVWSTACLRAIVLWTPTASRFQVIVSSHQLDHLDSSFKRAKDKWFCDGAACCCGFEVRPIHATRNLLPINGTCSLLYKERAHKFLTHPPKISSNILAEITAWDLPFCPRLAQRSV